MKNLVEKIKTIVRFLGPTVTFYAIMSLVVGVLLFALEYTFLFVLQSFLVTMNLVEPGKLNIPSWIQFKSVNPVVLLIVVAALRGLIWALRYFFLITISHFFVREQRNRLLTTALKRFDNSSNSAIMNTFGDHVLQAGAALQYVILFMVTVTSVALFCIYGFKIAPAEMLVSFMIMALVALIIKIYDKKIRGLSKEIEQERLEINKIMYNGLKNNFFVKISGVMDDLIQSGLTSLQKYEEHYRRYAVITSVRSSLPAILGGVMIGFVYYLSHEYFKTPAADLLTFFFLLLRISQGGGEISISIGEFLINRSGLAEIYRFFKVYDEQKQVTESRLKTLPPIKETSLDVQSISVRNLSFRYDQRLILNGVNLELKRGDRLLIVGESGSGKSTLLSAIAGLIEPTSGEVLFNGQYPTFRYHQLVAAHLSYVGPESYLFAGTVKENLLFGHATPKQVTDEQIWDALKKAQIDELVRSLPKQLSEILHDQTQLSTGQKQRLALARAWIRKPYILLLDEATANLDSETEANVIRSLEAHTQNMITIVISHKNSFSRFATQTLQLKAD